MGKLDESFIKTVKFCFVDCVKSNSARRFIKQVTHGINSKLNFLIYESKYVVGCYPAMVAERPKTLIKKTHIVAE